MLNGLAKGSFSPPSLVVKHLQSEPRSPSRTQDLSCGSYCAPLCAPHNSFQHPPFLDDGGGIFPVISSSRAPVLGEDSFLASEGVGQGAAAS
jgi:hypothetical protein